LGFDTRGQHQSAFGIKLTLIFAGEESHDFVVVVYFPLSKHK
jgi:hypothetical protein